jgi:hypothetical protein
VFWGTLAYTLIGGTFAGTILTLVFLPAMYSIWFRIESGNDGSLARVEWGTPAEQIPHPQLA